MTLYIDADAMPVAIREILFRASERKKIPLVLVANTPVKIPGSPLISIIIVPSGPDEADDTIVSLVKSGDLVITADIPLADRVVRNGALALDPRGFLFTTVTIKERLAMRNIKEELRNAGIDTGGPEPFSQKDRKAFAQQLDKLLSKPTHSE